VRRIACSLCSASAAFVALALAASPAGAATAAGSTTCWPATTQAFAASGDPSQYFLAPGGSFEAGTPAWSLAGGAAPVAGNNTAGGDPTTNTTSLSLPAGSTATSPPVCMNLLTPTIRFYVRNTGAATAKLGVTVLYTPPNGKPMSLQVAQITGTGVWHPSTPIALLMNVMALTSPTGTTNLSIQFRPLDATGQWRVDDVYVDPFKRL
jgi:hypothetical protein